MYLQFNFCLFYLNNTSWEGVGGRNGCWTSCFIDYVHFVIKTILVINFIIYLYVSISDIRKKLLKPYYYTKPNIFKFKELLSINKISSLKKICKLTKLILLKF